MIGGNAALGKCGPYAASFRTCPYRRADVPSLYEASHEGGIAMYGVFGGYTRWAVVFLIIFVLFFLFVPGYGYAGGAGGPGSGVAVTTYTGSTYGVYGAPTVGMPGVAYESPSSS